MLTKPLSLLKYSARSDGLFKKDLGNYSNMINTPSCSACATHQVAWLLRSAENKILSPPAQIQKATINY